MKLEASSQYELRTMPDAFTEIRGTGIGLGRYNKSKDEIEHDRKFREDEAYRNRCIKNERIYQEGKKQYFLY